PARRLRHGARTRRSGAARHDAHREQQPRALGADPGSQRGGGGGGAAPAAGRARHGHPRARGSGDPRVAAGARRGPRGGQRRGVAHPGQARPGQALRLARGEDRRPSGGARPAAHRDRRGGGQHGGSAARALARHACGLRRDLGAAGGGSAARGGPRAAGLDAHGDRAMTRPLVVAVDGPAGSGKSSVSKAASRALGFAFLDTGAAYRALTWLALERGVDTADAEAVVGLLDDFAYTTEVTDAGTLVRVGEADVTAAIREPRVSAVVSDVARVPEVRAALNEAFRRMIEASEAPGIVVEGRDITTVVAPDAPVRILLTADEAVRIARRSAELAPAQAATAQQLRERDRRDALVVDFLTAAPGVTTLDSTHLTFEQTVQAVVDLVRSQEKANIAPI